MSIINYAAKVINFKIVYYGPGLAGKTANLQYVHRCLPGQSRYNMTRKLVLRGVDGVVFVADSQWDRLKENVDSLRNLNDNLREYRLDLNAVPYVVQYNKRDLP